MWRHEDPERKGSSTTIPEWRDAELRPTKLHFAETKRLVLAIPMLYLTIE